MIGRLLPRRRKLSPPAARPDQTSLYWLIAALAMVLLPHLGRLPWWVGPLFLATAAWRILSARGVVGTVPAWLRLGLMLAGTAGVAVHYNTLVGRAAGIGLLSVMIALKLLETERLRDIYVLVTLGYFVAVTQFLYDQSFYLIAYLVVAVALVTATLIVVELMPVRAAGTRVEVDARGTLRRIGTMLLQGLPIMVLLFLLFPRMATPIWGLPEQALDAKTGVSGTMTPGSIIDLFIDDSPAFRARFQGAMPNADQQYWRGPVLWNFDGRTWRPIRREMRVPAPRPPQEVEPRFRYAVALEPTERRYVFALDMPLAAPPDATLLQDGMMVTQRPIIALMNYEMASDPDYDLAQSLPPERRELALRLPPGYNPRTLALARDWQAEGLSAQALVERALSWFNREFVYTFTPPPLGFHSVDDFLFDTQAGYCEYFASAFTVLMRAAGVPTRVVTGYQGGWQNASGNYLLVRQSDAHAWAEVWLEGRGWTRVDPTAAVAPERVNAGALAAVGGARGMMDFAWVRGLRNQVDNLHNFWNEWVLNFDSSRQSRLLQPFGIPELSPRNAMLLMIAVGTLVGLLISFLLLRQRDLAATDPAAAEYSRYCRKLARAGLSRQPGEGPSDFARRVTAARPDLATPVREITWRYLSLRYGRQGESEELERLRQAVHTLRV